MPTITVGTNCYITLAEAMAYHETRLHNDVWDVAADQDKERAIISASKMLESYDWSGEKQDSTQALAFPRSDMGDQIQDGTPQAIKDACAELAFFLLSNDYPDDPRKGVKRSKAGGVEVEYFSSSGGDGMKIPKLVQRLIRPFINAGGNLVRG